MFTVKCGYESMRLDDVKELLDQTYWAKGRDEKIIKASLENALCFGAFLTESGRQIGLTRVITDYATAFYLSDVIVHEDYRGMGVGKAIIDAVMSDPRLVSLRGILATRDAAGFYRKYGFEFRDGVYMDRRLPQA